MISPGGTADPSHNVKHAYFGDVTCLPGSATAATAAAVLIQPNAGTWVGEVWFVGCSLDAPDGGTSYQGGGVVLDPVGGGGGGGYYGGGGGGGEGGCYSTCGNVRYGAGGGGGGASSYVEKNARRVTNSQGTAPVGNGKVTIYWVTQDKDAQFFV